MSQCNQDIKDSLNEVSGLLSAVLEVIDEIICSFNKVGSEHAGFQLLTVLFETFDWIIQAFRNLNSSLADNRIESELKLLTRQFGSMLKCMENEDYVLLCDVLGTGTAEILKRIKSLVDEVSQ